MQSFSFHPWASDSPGGDVGAAAGLECPRGKNSAQREMTPLSPVTAVVRSALPQRQTAQGCLNSETEKPTSCSWAWILPFLSPALTVQSFVAKIVFIPAKTSPLLGEHRLPRSPAALSLRRPRSMERLDLLGFLIVTLNCNVTIVGEWRNTSGAHVLVLFSLGCLAHPGTKACVLLEGRELWVHTFSQALIGSPRGKDVSVWVWFLSRGLFWLTFWGWVWRLEQVEGVFLCNSPLATWPGKETIQ